VKQIDRDLTRQGAPVIPTVRYRDLPAAIEWLCTAFGFEQHRVIRDKNGAVLYAQLTFGSGMVMVAPIQETAFGKLMVQPDEIGGVETQICYLFVEDAKAHQERAMAAGAEIVLDIKVETNSGRGYSCRDLERHIWNFGTYDPWDVQATAPRPLRPRRSKRIMIATLLLALAGGGVYGYEPSREVATEYALLAYSKAAAAIEAAQAEQADKRSAGETEADRTLTDLREQLSKERVSRLAADRHVRDMRDQLSSERRAREAAELAAKEARDVQAASAASAPAKSPDATAVQAVEELGRMRQALEFAATKLEQTQNEKEIAERGAKEARDQLTQLRNARETAERAAREARDQASRERSARIAAERARKTASPSIF
jgi:uncharacterized glyoxalase superfamily protein PhnB